MDLMDKQDTGTGAEAFGSFFGHPEGQEESRKMVERLLKEFSLDYSHFSDILLSIPVKPNKYLTKIKPDLTKNFLLNGWSEEPKYEDSDKYKADFGREIEGRHIYVEVELSDVRRAVNAMFMARVFRVGYMRLGIYIAPESTTPEKGKNFYSMLKSRYKYIAPEYPLWLIGFSYP